MKRISVTLLALAVVAASTTIDAQRPAATGRSGFRALTGAAARAFTVPADVELIASSRVGRGSQIAAERYRQMFGDAEVLGGQLTVYRDDAGQADAVVGAYYPNLVPTNVVRITPARAQGLALARGTVATAAAVSLMIDPVTARYFYRVEARDDAARWFYWIDADTGAIVNEYNGLTSSSGTGVLGGAKDLTGLTTQSGGVYALVSADGRLRTYDARNRQKLSGTLATDDDDNWITAGSASPGQPALVDAQFFAHVTDTYYLSTYAFNWQTHYSQGVVSSAHYGRNYNNAYWNGVQMVYGDGDGTTFREFSADLDVVGHELSHGVTEATSNLIYQNESGALNESFSDVMGTAIEFYYGSGNWTIGEDVTTDGLGIRSLQNPTAYGDPSHYSDRYTGTGDNGGVHTNSGISNHWFYLLVNGGQNAQASRRSGVTVPGIGIAAAEDIAFLGFSALPATANFCAARQATIAVAGSYSANVSVAWDEVGVTAGVCDGGSGGGSDTGGPAISNVGSQKLKGTKFAVTWTTDEPATSVVTFTCCGAYSNSTLVTDHRMQFNGSVGYLYEYYVTSIDAAGNGSTEGPFYHQN